MPYVNCPPGLASLRMEDGTRYKATRPGGRVEVSGEHAAAIDRIPGNGTAGLVTAGFRVYGSSPKAGRWCRECSPARLWNPWNASCPKCGSATVPEDQGPAGPAPSSATL